MGLLGRFKNPFDFYLTLAVSPGSQQVSHGVELQHMLELHGVLALDDTIQGNVEDRVGRPTTMVGV